MKNPRQVAVEIEQEAIRYHQWLEENAAPGAEDANNVLDLFDLVEPKYSEKHEEIRARVMSIAPQAEPFSLGVFFMSMVAEIQRKKAFEHIEKCLSGSIEVCPKCGKIPLGTDCCSPLGEAQGPQGEPGYLGPVIEA